ncbi:hypothetical protein Csa_023858, partial [Cucumis sativus]
LDLATTAPSNLYDSHRQLRSDLHNSDQTTSIGHNIGSGSFVIQICTTPIDNNIDSDSVTVYS